MLRKLTVMFAFVFLAFGLLASPAAAYTLNADGTGFVGKGEVQLAYGWNNKTLQTNATGVSFAYSSVSETETTWTCDKDSNDNTQERARTTTTTTSGVVNGVARDGKSQVTGFNLLGFTGDPTSTSTTDGPPVGSCPTGWTAMNIVTSAPVVISGGFYANFGGDSRLLPNPPL